MIKALSIPVIILLSPATCCLVNPDSEKIVEKAFKEVKELSVSLREKYNI
ncbi:MAG: hypothetical protein PVG39_05485 [Desulfobacteraceae bacterium]